MLDNFYIDYAYYQENILPRQNKIDGHEILIIASTLVFGEGNTVKFIEPREYLNEDDIKVIRVPYKKVFNNWISNKLRTYKNVYSSLDKFKPDIIFHHGISPGYESKTIAKYLRNNSSTRLYMDCHADSIDTATNYLSKNVLHRFFYRRSLNKLVKFACKVYYIAPESKLFLNDLYKYNDNEKLEYLPLGGYIRHANQRILIRDRIRKRIKISEDDIVFIHTGKFDAKKRSYELISAFNRIESKKTKLLIIGKFNEESYEKVKDLINQDERILFLGWKNGDELQEYLCASDVYVQPGSMTVTVQNAICNSCAVIVFSALVYKDLFGGAALYADTEDEIYSQIKRLVDCPDLIVEHQDKLLKIAKEKLDYKVIANRYIEHYLSIQ